MCLISLTLTRVGELSRHISLLGHAVLSPARAVGAAEKPLSLRLRHHPFASIPSLPHSLQTGVGHVQVPLSSGDDLGAAHLHGVLASDEPLRVTGEADQIPFPAHLHQSITQQHTKLILFKGEPG